MEVGGACATVLSTCPSSMAVTSTSVSVCLVTPSARCSPHGERYLYESSGERTRSFISFGSSAGSIACRLVLAPSCTSTVFDASTQMNPCEGGQDMSRRAPAVSRCART